MGGGTATGEVGTTFPSVYPEEGFGVDEVKAVLEAEGRYEDMAEIDKLVGEAGASVSMQIFDDGTYEAEVKENIVEGDDVFSRLANYLHGRRKTFEGDLESAYSNFKQDEVLE